MLLFKVSRDLPNLDDKKNHTNTSLTVRQYKPNVYGKSRNVSTTSSGSFGTLA